MTDEVTPFGELVARERLQELVAFIATQHRLPRDEDGPLHTWVWRCRRGHEVLPRSVRAELDALLAAVPGARMTVPRSRKAVPEEPAARRVRELAAFVDEYGRLPRVSSAEERSLYNWVGRCRRGKVPMTAGLRAEFEALVSATPKVRKAKVHSGQILRRVRELAAFVDEHGRLPRVSSAEERSLYNWIGRCQLGKVPMADGVRAEFEALVSATPKVRKAKVGSGPSLQRANAGRSTVAARWTVDAARRALPRCRPEYEAVLRARVDHPDETLQQLGARCEMSKDGYAGLLRRALAGAG